MNGGIRRSGFGCQADREDRHSPNPIALGAMFLTAGDETGKARVIAAIGEHVIDYAKRRSGEAGAINGSARPLDGDVADEFLRMAKAEEAEIIVLGRRGLGA